MDKENIFADDGEYIANTYARYKVAFKSGNGALLYDFDGKEYIDCATGIGVNIFGVNDAEWKNAVDVSFSSKSGEICVCKGGYGVDFSEEEAKAVLSQDEVTILINLNTGSSSATAWGCDLTYDYVKINGDYRT